MDNSISVAQDKGKTLRDKIKDLRKKAYTAPSLSEKVKIQK